MKLQSPAHSRHKNLVPIVLAAIIILWSPDGSIATAQQLSRIEAANGKRTAYYAAGDPFLIAGFELLDSYWSEVARSGRHLLRGHLDNYLPIALKSLGHEPADALMRSFADDFFAARNPATGLIPYSYDSWLDESRTMRTRGKQPVALIARAVEFCQWFPEDPRLRDDCLAFAEATIKHFEFDLNREREGNTDKPATRPTPLRHGTMSEGHGFWGWVDVSSGGEPRIALAFIQDFGAVANGLAYLSQTTGDSRFMRWADRKLDFVWQNRMNPKLPVLNEQFIPTQGLLRPEELSSDSDTLYYVQHLFDLYDLTGKRKYRDWAIAVTDLWYERAWNGRWQHFVRKLRPDGTPAVNAIYGDAKYNTLAILIDAYEVTGDAKYIERFALAWNSLLRIGKNGFVPEHIKQGKMVREYGFDKQQSIFLDLLVAAYQASGDQKLLQAAEKLGERILEEGESVMRMEGGQAGNALLCLSLARRKIRRLEVELEGPHLSLSLMQDAQKVLDVVVPAEVAVVYLPEGSYELKIGKHEFGVSTAMTLDRNINETMFLQSP